jgi:exodeoxyribonuclease V alpha subunit
VEQLEATVADITYRNAENGYTVMQVRAGRDKVTVVGALPELSSGEQIILTGGWVEHPQYGKQWKAAGCEIVKPTTLLGIERYLGSGLIKGVGPATAKLIVSQFGKDALDILSEHPERLAQVPKIGPKRAAQIAESYHEQMHARQAMVFLQSYGVNASLAVKISRLYGDQVQAVIRENPYRLVEDIEGVGFLTADRIALSMGLAADSPHRVKSALKFILQEAASGSGHVFLPRAELVSQAVKMLRVPEDLADNALGELLLNREMISAPTEEEELGIYLPLYFHAEREVAQRLHELMAALPYRKSKGAQEAIRRFEDEKAVHFSPLQQKAVEAAVDEGILVITGGPGTGKTTIINCIIRLLSKEGDVLLCAPSGRAAKRMTEATGVEAKTIHRMLEYGGDESSFARGQDNPLEASCIIVDEMSMVDVLLMRNLLRAIVPGTRLILVGDADQLPPVGPGNVLGDILKSEAVPSVRLKEIFRQDENSMIVLNAHRINQGEMPVLNGRDTDVFLEKKTVLSEAAQTIVALCTQRLPGFLGLKEAERLSGAVRQIQVLSPTKKGECGVWALNRLLQEALNPPQMGKPSLVFGDALFRVGDKVMQTKNDYQIEWRRKNGELWEEGKGIFNGDVGFVEAIDPEDRTLTVRFDEDRLVDYEEQQRESLELAYCLSVHKSQGSEFPVVVLPVVGGPPMLLTRNLLYTAITRARHLVVLVGREEVIQAMVRNNHIARRYTTLCRQLKEWVGWIA